jgi:hypothetical protein
MLVFTLTTRTAEVMHIKRGKERESVYYLTLLFIKQGKRETANGADNQMIMSMCLGKLHIYQQYSCFTVKLTQYFFNVALYEVQRCGDGPR